VKDLRKAIKLNQMVLRFVPPTYIKYLNENMDTKIIVSKIN